ncbi:Carboxy-cis,cis-muconate cyclase [Purpureocillium takamizusanense]|uniref:Carboxy-cis,cis-muconate cyclase n=1 Tax=Purpureocillium takamizusanense TaxID=2060973 RepID=A0A9Q8QG59_9HYPO|nr:Carboxy-cis,cis-muconate cyclase [Purpureocillium takamizusanense]UNI18284.1 Carboxy-cis,cis-muconate cyclase [Purpureocillium takamizusanense]
MPVHHLMVGTWTPPGAIFTFAFDDEALTLKLVHRTPIPEDEPISWMTFDHAKKTIYGAAMKKWSSYAVESPTSIVHQASHPMLHHPQAASPETNTRAIFLLASRKPPNAVYCNPFYSHAGHGTVFAVDARGGLVAPPLQHYAYQSDSGVHGMVFDPAEEYLYSADLAANKVWVHRRRPRDLTREGDGDTNSRSPELDLVGAVDCPDPRDHPRWVAMHPSGRFLYVLMEKGNRLCECAVDPATRLPVFDDARAWPLIPPGIPDRWTQYRADVCALSASGRYLFASSRANSFDLTGYVAAFRLADGDGRVERHICLNPTPTSGGHSNAVAPSDWSDEWLAITDDQEGWLEIYRWQDEFLARVARVRVPEPGFGMNAIWYD